ncbi:hypothetical protein IC763_05920 [Acinetobacter seifertii]|nr:hypothetical protein IC763_05920 [Acinetobacter seifertii]
MNEKYKIESLGDFLKIPADRIKDCLAELGEHLFSMRQTIDNFGVEPTGDEVKSFTWEDDGKQDLAIKATIGDEVVEMKFTKAESKEG